MVNVKSGVKIILRYESHSQQCLFQRSCIIPIIRSLYPSSLGEVPAHVVTSQSADF